MSARRLPLKSEFPVVVERGPTGLKGTTKIYFNPVTTKGKRYSSYVVSKARIVPFRCDLRINVGAIEKSDNR